MEIQHFSQYYFKISELNPSFYLELFLEEEIYNSSSILRIFLHNVRNAVLHLANFIPSIPGIVV